MKGGLPWCIKMNKSYLALLSLVLLMGCVKNASEPNQEELENQLRLQCPCMMFSDKQKEIFKQLESLDYFVVVPASGLNSTDSIRLEKSTRFGVRVSNSCYVNKKILGAADTDENRFRKFCNAMHTDHKILWALRGGYGSYRLIDFLKDLPAPKHKKIFVGFSDTTAMSLFISQNWKNWEVIHAPVFVHLVNSRFYEPAFSLLMKILHGSIESYSIENLKPVNRMAKKKRKVAGKVTGGNLSLIETSLATNWEMQTKNKIVFLEDVGETAERVHRVLYHLKQSGKFRSARAIVFGSFTGSAGDMESVIKQFAKGFHIPVYVTDQFGHGKVNMPIVYNAKSQIHNGKWTITLPKNWKEQW